MNLHSLFHVDPDALISAHTTEGGRTVLTIRQGDVVVSLFLAQEAAELAQASISSELLKAAAVRDALGRHSERKEAA